MRKNVFGRQFKRDVNERKALFRGLVSSLVINERIRTTEEKAKAIRAHADKLVTKAKKQDRLHAYSLLQPYLNAQAVKKMLDEIAPRFASRQGGYTRILRVGKRFNDNASLVNMEWVEIPQPVVEGKTPKKTRTITKKEAEVSTATSKANQAKKASVKTQPEKKTSAKKSAKKEKTK